VINSCGAIHLSLPRLNTDIKLPKVFGYNLDEQNPVGCPFSIMEYIHGNTAEEVSQSYSGDHEGIPPKFREKFWGQMATIMVQLASIRVPKIGSIFRSNTDTDLYIVGPMVETGSGPYGSAAEFYRDFPSALGSSLEREGEPVPGQDELLRAFQYIALSLPEPKGNGFGLANYDLNPNNILVDQEFNVLGVIDWDSVVALPDIALYRLPFLMGISCAVPGIVPSHPLEIKRHELGHRFAQIVEAVSQEQTTNRSDTKSRSTSLFTRAGFFSKGALAFRSLVFVKMKQDFVNSEWLQGLQWLGEHDEEEVAKFYFGG
jgi:hypothetical protein